MIISRKLTGLSAGMMLVLASGACETDLDITNPNNPDIERALATAEDVQNIATSTINSWYLTSTYVEPYMMLGVTADALGANFGNFGMRFNNLEPRIPYENNSAGGDRAVTERPWEDNYSTLGAANDVIRAMRSGRFEEGEIPVQYEHLAMFSRVASLTNLALIFDRAFVVNEAFNPETDPEPELMPFADVADSASKWWDELIAATEGETYAFASSVFPLVPGPLNAVRLNRIANTMHALLLAYTPRRAADVAAVDWEKVRALAEKGIGTGTAGDPFDVVVQGDATNWWSYINYYGNEPSWVRVDQRLINRMDPTIPPKFNGTIVTPGQSPDKRYLFMQGGDTTDLEGDFTFAGNVIGDPGRGIYMQTPFWHSRYAHHRRFSPTGARTAVPYLLAAESDLVLAEALIRTGGSLEEAATLINKTRVGRGGLPAATAAEGADKLLEYIDYEREIELLNTNGWAHFRRRHVDGLQPGTVRHLPIPAKELETLQLPIYTFGGSGPDM